MSTHNFARLLMVAIPVLYSNWKAPVEVAKVKLHGKYLCGIIIVHACDKCRCTTAQTGHCSQPHYH